MSAKHFCSDASQLVTDSLRSLTRLNPSVMLKPEHKVVLRSRQENEASTVSIVSGGGSGHEPAFGAYVGEGVLAAAVAGTIFASPNWKQILYAIESVDAAKGVLVTVMNYTGDVLNFGVAVEKAKARKPKLAIEMLVVGDDAGVPRQKAGQVGRRGIAGIVLVHKITGAAAAAGMSLSDVVKLGRLVCDNLASIGVSLGRVHVPGRGQEDTEGLDLGNDEVELGMGIHNESGSGRRTGEQAKLPALIQEMLKQLLGADDEERSFLPNGVDKVVLLLNNLGGLSVLEMGAITSGVIDQLTASYNIEVVRAYAGTYLSTLNGNGFSISLLNVSDIEFKHTLLQLLDAQSQCIGWSTPLNSTTWSRVAPSTSPQKNNSIEAASQSSSLKCDIADVQSRIKRGLEAVIAAEPEITRYDDVVGDGDCGTTMKRGAEGVRSSLSYCPENIVQLLELVTEVVEGTMDGTSGALYSIFLNALTSYFRTQPTEHTINVDVIFWAKALRAAMKTLEKYTPARIGDRTLVDALQPFVDTLQNTSSLEEAAKAALSGASDTKHMKAKLGRAVYVREDEQWVGKIPDPGAWGLSQFLLAIADLPPAHD